MIALFLHQTSLVQTRDFALQNWHQLLINEIIRHVILPTVSFHIFFVLSSILVVQIVMRIKPILSQATMDSIF